MSLEHHNRPPYPKEDDEPSYKCRLFCGPYSVYTELSGWSSFIPIAMGKVGLRDTTKFTRMVDDDSGKTNQMAQKWIDCDYRRTIREASKITNKKHVNAPILVQVVAKRSVQVIKVRGRILLIPTLIVADESGYCMLTSMNEGLKVVYNSTDIGDILLITNYQPQKPDVAVHKHLFSDKLFVDLELKFQFYSARHSYHYQFNPEKSNFIRDFKIPVDLFDETYKLLSPTDAHVALAKRDETLVYFDLIGVISYVGRMERYQRASQMQVEDKDGQLISVPKFVVYRWLQLIDRNSAELPVRIYIFNQTLDCQQLLLPGTQIAISHCKLKEDIYASCTYVVTSEFSHIYVKEKLTTYFVQRPLSFWEKAKDIFGRAGYIELLLRDDLKFTIGGTFQSKIVNETQFMAMYAARKQSLHHGITSKMARRESRYLFIEGRITRAVKVIPKKNSDAPQLIQILKFHNNTMEESSLEQPCNEPTVLTWYSFIRELPKLDIQILEKPKSRMICDEIVNRFQKYSGPLLLPSRGDLEDLANLVCLDGPPYLEVDLFKEASMTEWKLVWKHSGISMDDKMYKLQSASGKLVVCLIEVFFLDAKCPLEMSLIDFFNMP